MQVRTRAIVLGALVVGSVAAVDPAGLAPFGPAKWLVISTLGALGVGVTLWSTGGRADRRTWWAWAALVALLTLAALMSGDVPTALLGQPDRHAGVLTWLLVWALFCAGQRLDRTDIGVVMRSIATAAAVLGCWSVVELAGGHLVAIATDSRRLTGPFGSAAFLGAASCLLLPVAAGIAADRGSPQAWRIIGALGAIATLVALIGSGSRAAWLGTLVAVVALLVVRHRSSGCRAARPAGWRAAGRTGRPAGWPSARRAGWRPERWRAARRVGWQPILVGLGVVIAVCCVLAPRLGDITSRPHGATSRTDEWTVAARVIADHPLIGVGPEGYRIAAPEGIDRYYERTYGRDDVLPDRAHSAPLDVALIGGLPAAALFVALVGFVVWRALGLLRTGQGMAVDAGLAVGVIAYAVQQLLLFPLAEVDPVWWLCCGIVMTRSRPPATAPTEPTASTAPTASTRPQRQRAVAASVAAVTIAALALVAGTLDVAADRLARRALDAAPTTGVDDADRAVRLRPDDVRYRLVAAVVHSRRGSLADVDLALDQIDAARRWSANDPVVRDEHAVLLAQRASITGTTDDIAASLAAWRALVVSDPHRARWQLELGRAAALAGDVAQARAAWHAAADLDPSDPTAGNLLARLPDA